MNYKMEQDSSIYWKKTYDDFVEALNIGFILTDMNYKVLEYNERVLEMTGFRRDQLKGRHLREIFIPVEFKKLEETVSMFRKRGEDEYQYEIKLPSANGDGIPALINSHINRDTEGNRVSVYSMITEIQEQKKIQTKLASANQVLLSNHRALENEKKMLETILFGIGDCVTMFHPDGKIMLSNPQGMKIRGNRRSPLLPLVQSKEERIVLQINSEQREFIGQMEAVRDGVGEVFAFVEILRDVTPMKKFKLQEQELLRIKREMRRKSLESKMIGVSAAMQNVFDLILRCAEVDFGILILGETGVGKEMVARTIHGKSARKNKPFVAVNCGALPETLLESELFGNVKGAFTGATSDRLGLFREAEGGVIFLDEIGDVSKDFQVKLLRVLEEKEIRPVGSSKSYHVDVRVIAATNRDLKKLLEEGLFRHDLYYRIAVIPLTVPPLRERKEDIIPLAEHFIKKHQDSKRKPTIVLDHQIQHLLLEHSWSGNVRELENAMKHALAMGRGKSITKNDLPVQIVLRQNTNQNEEFQTTEMETLNRLPHKGSLKDLSNKFFEAEKESIVRALRNHDGNRALTAKELGISRTTLWRKIAMYQLDW